MDCVFTGKVSQKGQVVIPAPIRKVLGLKNFYQSDYYSWLETNDPKMVKNVEDAQYEDPDNFDVELYKDLSLKYDLECKKCNLFVGINKQKIKMSADIVCGIKSLKDLGSSTPEFLSNYAKIRSSVKLHFIWPQHKVPTINIIAIKFTTIALITCYMI